MKLRHIVTALLFVLPLCGLRAQVPDVTVSWKAEAAQAGDGLYELIFTGETAPGWHTYGTASEYSAPSLTLEKLQGCEPEGGLYDISEPAMEDGEPVFEGTFRLGQKIRLTAGSGVAGGYITWLACTGGSCASPTDWEFELPLGAAPDMSHSGVISNPVEESSGAGSLWALILEAILWGFAMLLTPCVFPMVPMTVSFFLKGSTTPAAGRFKAFMYGLSIVLLYTVPISVIILLTRLLGGDTVTADIFNWLATHWLPNLIFFVVFMVFAASFFGAFEIVLPSSLVGKSDKNSEKGGLAGIFFMALTLVLVSFSCTGPIVGSVLIRSTAGEFWAPMVTMLAFSVAFALPFTVLALFPSLLGKLKGKSGSWMNSVKVVLGFIEVALGFKFLSVADQTYHWGILDREVYLAIWIVVFTLLGLYLLGKIKFPHDDPEEKPLGVFRLGLVIAVFSFVVYMVPGMWGAPLKALSGYLPPLETQDFVLSKYAPAVMPAASTGVMPAASTGVMPDPDRASSPAILSDSPVILSASEGSVAKKYDLKMPLGLDGYFTLEEGLAASKRLGRPVFVDITGHGCVNCREMEQRVWSDPRVLQILRDEYVVVALYTDDKTKLAKEDWVTLDNGRVLKDLGRVNSWLVRERFGVNAQPNYALLDSSGALLAPVRGYNLDIDGFIAFLRSGVEAYCPGSVLEVAGRQGVACDGEYYYVSGSTALYKYTLDGTLALSNETPFKSITAGTPAPNHIGDIDVFEGEIYAGCEYFMDGEGKNIQTAIYDAATLKYKRSITWEPASGQVECCGLAVDRRRGLVWMADWVNGSHLYCYDRASGKYVGKVALDPAPKLQQGIFCLDDGRILISSDDGDADRGEPDHLYVCSPYRGSGKELKDSAEVDVYMVMSGFRRAGEIEGLCVNPGNGDLIVLSNRGARIVLGMPRGFYDGYDREIHELYLYSR